MPSLYRAICIKEIFWKGKTYRINDPINIVYADVQILREAGVIGNALPVIVEKTEFAINKAPENAMKPHNRRARK